jgi:hypothetical protein
VEWVAVVALLLAVVGVVALLLLLLVAVLPVPLCLPVVSWRQECGQLHQAAQAPGQLWCFGCCWRQWPWSLLAQGQQLLLPLSGLG